MNHPQKPPGASGASRTRRAVLGGLVLVAVIAAVYRVAQPRASRTEPARPLSELVRVDGRLVLRDATNVLFTGWITDQYPDGTLKSRSQVVEGRLQGVSEGWYTNGQLQVREQFVRGVSDGPRVKWHANGSTQSQAVVVQGELEGPFYRWHEQGTLAEAVNLKRGQPDGVSHAFYPSGFLKARVRLEGGKVVEQQFWKDGEQAGSDRAVAAAAPGAGERRN